MPNPSNNLVGAAGEYFVCAELCRRGYVALLTPKNNPLFDVVATTEDARKSVTIQVKTRSIRNQQGWKLGISIEEPKHNESLFVVLVNLEESGVPEFYIYDYDVLANRVAKTYSDYIAIPKKDGSPKKVVGFRWHDTKYFNEDDKGRKNNWSPIERALA